jgi:hypothetical protein
MSTEVSTINNTLIETLAKIESKLQLMKETELVGFKTHGGFRWNPAYTGNAAINIHTTKNLSKLLNIYASLSVKETSYNKAAEDNGLSEYPAFMWQDTLGNSWLHDLKLRISTLTHNVKKSELTSLKNELSQFMIKDDKIAIALAKVNAIV